MAFTVSTSTTIAQSLTDAGDTGIVTRTGTIRTTATAVEMSGSGAILLNSGTISGLFGGVVITGAGGVVLNEGLIASSSFLGVILVRDQAEDSRIVNSGTIQGTATGAMGVFFEGTGEVINHGIITALDDYAVRFDGTGRLENHGQISSLQTDVAVIMSAQGDVVQNNGTINGLVELQEGSDLYVGNGRVNGSILAGDGNDTIDLRGGFVTGDVRGGIGNDTYRIDDDGIALVELFNSGSDTVRSAVDYTLATHFEALVLLGAATQGTGNAQDNSLIGNGHNNLLDGEVGNDTLDGLNGTDTLLGDEGDDLLLGGKGADDLNGGSGADTLSGNEGHDRLEGDDGADRLVGFSGNDTLLGGQGGDVLFGGQGYDFFEFRTLADSSTGAAGRDRIEDFQSGIDRIDLSALDANVNNAADTAFTPVGAFGGTAGQLILRVAAGNGFLEGDVNGDGTADFSIQLTGITSLIGVDLIL